MTVALPAEYRSLLEGGAVGPTVPSWLVAVLPPEAPEPTVTDVLRALEQSGAPIKDRRVLPRASAPDAVWQIEVELDRPGPRVFQLWSQSGNEALTQQHLEWGRLTGSDIEAVQKSRFAMGISAVFGAQVLDDFHLQMQLLAAAAPSAVAMLDVAACWPHPGAWLRECAAAKTPPAPHSLFCVHSVYDDEVDGTWLHTHGLTRCGTMELEMLEVPGEQASLMGQLINAVAAMFIEHRPPAPGEPFFAGEGLELIWLPWQSAVNTVKRRSLGGKKDRDEAHRGPSGVLFAPGKKTLGLFGSAFKNPACYAPILEKNPLLYVSNMETQRMALLARERLDRFRALESRFRDQEGWMFLVKLGYTTDQAETPTDREHLWFRVHAVEGENVDATLLNEPYHIARMHEGQRSPHHLDKLSDWTILCTHGRFGPDSVVHLERLLSVQQVEQAP